MWEEEEEEGRARRRRVGSFTEGPGLCGGGREVAQATEAFAGVLRKGLSLQGVEGAALGVNWRFVEHWL